MQIRNVKEIVTLLGPSPDALSFNKENQCPPPSRRPLQAPLDTPEQLAAWRRKRTRKKVLCICLHWSITLLLNLIGYLGVCVHFKNEMNCTLGVLYMSGFISMIMYWVVAVLDPGYVPIKGAEAMEGGQGGQGPSDPWLARLNPSEDEGMSEWVKARRCPTCCIRVPLRAKHCRSCYRCVRLMDHHCAWLGTCVGEDNHVPFLAYLIFQSLHLTVALYILFPSCSSAYLELLARRGGHKFLLLFMTLNVWLTVPSVIRRQPLHSLLCLVVLLLWIFVNCVLLVQVKGISSNLLINESLHLRKYPYLSQGPGRSPFDRGCVKNWVEFLFRPGDSTRSGCTTAQATEGEGPK